MRLFTFVWLFATLSAASLTYQTLDKAVIEQRLESFGTSNQQREQIVKDMFSKAGCPADQLQELLVKHVDAPNVSCTLPGQSEAIITVGAHFDFVKAGQGVIDNWSGASLLPSLYESLDKVPRHHRFVFISFTEEEPGLIGSKAYVHSLTKAQLKRISAMVNIDSLAIGPTKVELDRADRDLVGGLGRIAKTLNLPLGIVNVHKVGQSDSDSFQDAGVPSILIHSITQPTFEILHSKRDTMKAVKLDDYYQSYQLIVAYLAYLDGKLPAAAPAQ